ncbi:NADP-dependent oxidoreductase domain-containing protein [Mycotypha africana]|uniref:NADP-dependent oxidoreductase domain-containing protein n=1 Tax=Mycotypha africana TaxID=64632 RepID=UPI0023000494|nr:NADP-dependent oxidoreductase domain-containing protein [Mycotypha africana]KAI8992168.1 NADP-dependent oxidoreductase domain-containing protein [Mycotypha africana]
MSFLLNNGVRIPAIGLGTWQSKPNDVYNAVLTALKTGYTHIDTAYVYRNEKEVGQAIKDSGIPRERLFITTKLWNTSHRPELVEEAITVSLTNLQLEYVDLYLMHWPIAFQPSKYSIPKTADGRVALDWTVDFVDTYKAMEKLVKNKKARAIGVSNFNKQNLQKLLKSCNIIPAVNQVEMHSYLPQPDLLQFCQSKQIHVTAYSPLGSTNSPIMEEPLVLKIAQKYNITQAQVLLSWGIQRGCSVIPKSVTASRIVSNFKTVKLDREDFEQLQTLKGIDEPERLLDPSSIWGVEIYKPKL